MRRGSTFLPIVLLVGLVGCRLHIEHVKDGTPIPPEAFVHLQLGQTSLDQVLAVAGAPSGLEWAYSEDTLVYDSATSRSTRWVVDNPYSYVSGVTPQGAVGELVTYVMFAANTTRQALAPPRPVGGQTAPIPMPPGGAASGVAKPMRLNGDSHGWEEFRFTFDRETQLLQRVEVSRTGPAGGVGGIAAGTFLR